MKNFFLLLSGLLFSAPAIAQQYQLQILPNGDSIYVEIKSRGDSLLELGDLPGAIDAYKKIYRENPSQPKAAYNVAAAYAKTRQVDSAFTYLFLHLKTDTTVEACTDPFFISLWPDKRWGEFREKAIKEVEIRNKKSPVVENISLAKKLWEMMALDQAYYYEIDVVEKKFGRDCFLAQEFWDRKEALNKANVRQLDSIVLVNGWPTFSQVGHFAAGGAFLIVQHSEPALQKKYLPVIESLCKKKEADWSDYALMYDRVQTSEGKPQRYGSQVRFNPQTGQNEFFPIEDENNVDKRRKEVGLEPLAQYATYFGIKYEPKK